MSYDSLENNQLNSIRNVSLPESYILCRSRWHNCEACQNMHIADNVGQAVLHII